jgi:hypothetical protein
MSKPKALLLAAGLALSAPEADARWYLGHHDAEVCVPVDDIGFDGRRLYYGAGPAQAPEDYVALSERYNGWLYAEVVKDRRPGIKVYRAAPPNSTAWAGDVIFFNDKKLCQFLMSRFEQ